MRPEVAEAVADILHGTAVDSHTEWLQREYLRLMRRECQAKMLHESKFKKDNETANKDGNPVQNRAAEQHGTEEHNGGADVDT